MTIVQLFIKAFSPDLDKALGIYLPLIVVNCIILGRAEMYASKNRLLPSILDGLGMGVGFIWAARCSVCKGIIRIFGAGSLGFPILSRFMDPILIFLFFRRADSLSLAF